MLRPSLFAGNPRGMAASPSASHQPQGGGQRNGACSARASATFEAEVVHNGARFGDGHPVAQRVSSSEEIVMSYTGVTLNMIYACFNGYLECAPCEVTRF
jgi:hypothetical protein